jgi:hypothetical protein
MKTTKGISRRSFLKGTAAAAGALAFSANRRGSLFGEAHAATPENSALLVVYTYGGYNALFASADSFLSAGNFGVTSSNVANLGNGLVVDQSTLGSLPAIARTKMASVGVRHGASAHGEAQMLDFYVNDQAAHLRLAAEIGGNAAIKAATVGAARPPGNNTAVQNVSLQPITEMSTTIAALGNLEASKPKREPAALAISAARSISTGDLARNPRSLRTMADAYPASVATLSAPVKPFSFSELSTAYNLQGSTSVNSFASQMAAAELMIVAGANVVVAADGTEVTWDTHNDVDGQQARTLMQQRIMPGLSVFLSRMLADPNRNVVVCIMGDFSRSLPGSDHQPNLTATVIGKYVKVGTTGRVGADVSLPQGTPAAAGLWAYLAALMKCPTTPFGANPHTSIIAT